MNIYQHIHQAIASAVQDLAGSGKVPAGLDLGRVSVEPPRDAAHGDVATNAAMVLAGAAGMAPRPLANLLSTALRDVDGVAQAAVAGPGFINLRLSDAFWQARLAEIIAVGTPYGDSPLGAGQKVNVEYVSANPTGPLHVGHGRGAVVGDALAGLLEKAGYAVTREYYVNDAGGQVDALARSLRQRYLVAVGAQDGQAFERLRHSGEITYGGEYLLPAAMALAGRDGAKWVDASEDTWLPVFRDFAIAQMLALIRDDLGALGVVFDVTVSERSLGARGMIDDALRMLDQAGLIYVGALEPPKGKLPDDWEARPQTLFRSTAFGDDIDRPLRKSDGTWTYFAGDIAYHLDKFRRGFATQINVWGADHGGYVKRVQAAVTALTDGRANLDVKLCQMVNLLEGGEPVKMSKRAGTFITLREVLDRVGRDVFRFIMLTRRNDAPLDFDFQKVTEQSKDNPVFYVQYAHARCCSVLRHAAETLGEAAIRADSLSRADFGPLTHPAELDVIKAMAHWPRVVENAAMAHEPHRIAFYLHELAGLFHVLWTKGKEESELRFLHPDNRLLSLARLGLVRGTQIVLASGLKVIGVEPVEEMR